MLKIRQFKLPDLSEVMEIEKTSFPKSRPYPKTYFLKYLKKYPQGFIVAENRGRVLGYTIGDINNKATAKRKGEIVSLAVSPKSRQKGIGANLTNFLINLLRKDGAKDIILNVRTGNKTALSFYRRLGFKIVKQVKEYYLNGDNAYVIRKKLDE